MAAAGSAAAAAVALVDDGADLGRAWQTMLATS